MAGGCRGAALVCLLGLAGCVGEAGSGGQYDDLVEQIIGHSKQAAQLHNAGQPTAAQQEVLAALAAADSAKRLEPENPQAYLTAATFLLNVQRFEESLQNWAAALTRLPADRPDLVEYVQERAEFTRLGLISVERDRVYRGGVGNVSRAAELVREQLAIYQSPQYFFDLGTMQVMLSQAGLEPPPAARESFAQAAQASAEPAAAVLRALKGGRCPESAALHPVESLPGWVSASRAWEPAGAYGPFEPASGFVATAQRQVSLFGPDGVVAAASANCRLEVLGSSSWPFVALHGQFWLLQSWRPKAQEELYDHYSRRFAPPGPGAVVHRLARAASVVQFAATNYYHFMLELVPRLVMLKPLLLAEPELPLIVPGWAKHAFISQVFDLLPWLDHARLVAYDVDAGPGERLAVERLSWADWTPVGMRDGDAVQQTHCLAPKPALEGARAELVAGLNRTSRAGRPSVVFLTRRGASMRVLKQEDELVARLQQVVQPHGAELVIFDSRGLSVPAQAAIFGNASAVVGVHGAAFANTIFCEPGTAVLELAFQGPFTQHYAHAAAALGLLYERFPLVADERGVGSQVVVATESVLEALVSRIGTHLARRRTREL